MTNSLSSANVEDAELKSDGGSEYLANIENNSTASQAKSSQKNNPPLVISNKSVFVTVSLTELLNEELPQRELTLDPIIPERGLAMLFAGRGVGKTHVGLGIAYAVATGGPFLKWNAPKARKVLYIDGEMPQQALQERVRAIAASSKHPLPSEDYFTFLSMDRQLLGQTINLANVEHQFAIETILEDIDFMIIDNISTLINSGRENDAASWDGMQTWLLQLRRRGITVLLIHHSGRGENARGTSKREDVLDTVLHLKRPNDYKMTDGARFEVHLTKARGISGSDAAPFEARLEFVNGASTWEHKVLEEEGEARVVELTKSGRSVRDIAGALSMSKSSVQRLQAELRAQGRV